MGAPLRKRIAWHLEAAMRIAFEGRFPFRDPTTIERVQAKRVRRAVAHAHAHVPYYRETMARLGLGPGDFHSAADLSKLPLIERAQIQRDPEYFFSETADLNDCVALSSSGSTDAPLTVYHDPRSVLLRVVDRQRPRRVITAGLGKRSRYRQVELVPPNSSSQLVQGAIAQLKLLPWSISVEEHHLDMLAPVAENVARLNELKPDLLRGYGSAVEAVFAHVRATGCAFEPPKVVGYGADSISNPMRRMIIEEFGIPIVSIYSAIEIGQIGFECEEHRGLHLNIDLHPLRLVTPDGTETAGGESGEVVVSSLANRATVLLNYRLGDLAHMVPGDCACGRNLPVLSFIEGRTVDWLRTRDGRKLPVQAIRLLFNWEPRIWRYQVIQDSLDRFRVLLVTAPGSDRAEIRKRVGQKFSEALGAGVSTQVEFVEELPRGARGKTPAVVPLGH